MNIIALLGWKNSGKDTIAKHLVKRYNFYHLKFAQYIKDAANAIFPNITLFESELSYLNENNELAYWEIDKDTSKEEFGGRTKREVLIDLAKYLKSTYGDDIFVNNINREIELMYEQCPNLNIVISDLRFMVEFDWLRTLDFAQVYYFDITRNLLNNNEIYTEYLQIKNLLLNNSNYSEIYNLANINSITKQTDIILHEKGILNE